MMTVSGAELFGEFGGVAVRQRQEDHVMAGERVGSVGSSTRSASGSRCGWCSASVVPALAAAVSAPMVSRPSA